MWPEGCGKGEVRPVNCKTPAEIAEACSLSGVAKAGQPTWRMLSVGTAAGMILAFAAAVTNTAAHSLGSASAMRLVSGLLFPFGLAIIILLGSELFTGNMLMAVTVWDKRITAAAMFKNLVFVYIGNWLGGLLVAAGCVYSGQLNYSEGGLAVYTVKLAAAKCAMAPGKILVMGILCNLLVCAGVLLALAAGDITGKILGAYLPVSLFVICGFEHCVANMYYIPAGLLASYLPAYAELAAGAGLDLSHLNWSGYLIGNLLPATAGNMIGGALIAYFMWACHLKPLRRRQAAETEKQAVNI